MRSVPHINLFKKRNKPFVDNFIQWALTVGRLLVIVTEIVALSAFLYRFSLDRELVDLHDEVEQKQAIIKLLKNNEEKYRNLQDRLSVAGRLSTNTEQATKTFTDVVALSPADFAIGNLNLSQQTLKIDATTQSVKTLVSFIDSLRNYPTIQSVSLDRIENKTTSATIVVSITARLKQQLP